MVLDNLQSFLFHFNNQQILSSQTNDFTIKNGISDQPFTIKLTDHTHLKISSLSTTSNFYVFTKSTPTCYLLQDLRCSGANFWFSVV